MRKIVLEGHRFTPSELLDAGLVDEIIDGGSEAVLARACEIAEQWSGNARAGVWGVIRVSVIDNYFLNKALQTDIPAQNGTHQDVLQVATLTLDVPSKSRL